MPNWRVPFEFCNDDQAQKTRMTGLPNGEVWQYVHSFSYNITTWQIDRQMNKNATTILPCHTDMRQTWYSIRQPHNAIAVCGKFIKKKKKKQLKLRLNNDIKKSDFIHFILCLKISQNKVIVVIIACVRNDMSICNLDGVNPLDRNSWRTSVRCCQVLPTPESGTTAAP